MPNDAAMAREYEHKAWQDYLEASLALAKELEQESGEVLERFKEIYATGDLPQQMLMTAKYKQSEARLNRQRIEALMKLVAQMPVERLSVSLSA